MQYKVRCEGLSPIIHHAGIGIDPELPVNKEIARIASKKASTRTETENQRLRQLEVVKAIWWDGDRACIPEAAIRACIEAAARKLKQGPDVREGLLVFDSVFDHLHCPDPEILAKEVEFTVPVVVQRARILRTRAKFELPWSVEFVLDVDPDLIERAKIETWLDIAGRRMGLGDWRPAKSGQFGRFIVAGIDEIRD